MQLSKHGARNWLSRMTYTRSMRDLNTVESPRIDSAKSQSESRSIFSFNLCSYISALFARATSSFNPP